MELITEWVTFGSGRHASFSVRPAAVSTPLPTVIVIQEAWGVDAHIEDVASRFAMAGYAAVAPDLFWADGARPPGLVPERTAVAKRLLDQYPGAWQDPGEREAALAELPEQQRDDVAETLAAVSAAIGDLDTHVDTLRANINRLVSLPLVHAARYGSVGFCVGGALVGRLATMEPRLGCGVIFYGAPPPADHRAAISCPLLGFYGGDDERITSQVPEFAAGLEAAGKSFEYYVYPAAPHAFFNDTRIRYRVDPARDAWARSLTFFARHLGP